MIHTRAWASVTLRRSSGSSRRRPLTEKHSLATFTSLRVSDRTLSLRHVFMAVVTFSPGSRNMAIRRGRLVSEPDAPADVPRPLRRLPAVCARAFFSIG